MSEPTAVVPAAIPSASENGGAPQIEAAKDIAAQRPELLVGGAFAGGLVAALILRRLGGR